MSAKNWLLIVLGLALILIGGFFFETVVALALIPIGVAFLVAGGLHVGGK